MTGGEQVQASNQEQLTAALETLLGEMRQQHFLAIDASTKPGWHKLEVKKRGARRARERIHDRRPQRKEGLVVHTLNADGWNGRAGRYCRVSGSEAYRQGLTRPGRWR